MGITKRFSPLLGESAAIRDLRDFIVGVSLLEDPVLITGAVGTGKSLAASKIHAVGRTDRAAYLKVSCDRYEPEELEQLLFSGRPGPERAGLLGSPSGITCYIAGIEHLPAALARRLARYLRRTTAPTRRPRLIFGSRYDLAELRGAGLVDAGLLDAVAAYHVRVPLLRERIEDIPLLCNYQVWLNTLEQEYEERWSEFQRRILCDLLTYPWPGNIRELFSVVRAFCGAGEGVPRRFASAAAGNASPAAFLRRELRSLHRQMLDLLRLEERIGCGDLLLDSPSKRRLPEHGC